MHLSIAEDKCKALVFGNLARSPIFKLGQVNIPVHKELLYLGVVLDCRLSWLPHLQHIKNKVQHLTFKLLRMTGIDWGPPADILRKWYSAVAERIILYAASVWALPFTCYKVSQLLSIQRIFLLRITRAYRNTSTAALQVMAGIPPIDLVAEQEARIAKLLRLKDESALPPFSPEDFEIFHHDIEINPAFNHLHHTFETPEVPSCVQLFTDGSKIGDKVGTAFVAFRNQQLVHTWQRALRSMNTVFQAELVAILEAVKWVRKFAKNETCAIYSDSMSSLQAISIPCSKYQIVRDIRRHIRGASHTIHLNWIKAHNCSLGNELADDRAKQAALDDCIPLLDLPLPHCVAKSVAKTDTMTAWQTFWSTTDKGRHLFLFVPNIYRLCEIPNREIILFATGHGPFPEHMHRIGLANSPVCVCGAVGTPLHYAFDCRFTQNWHFTAVLPLHPSGWFRSVTKCSASRAKLTALMQFLIQNVQEMSAVTSLSSSP